jgi:hypothetical protein
VHEILYILAEGSLTPPPPDNTLKAAIVSACAVVLAAAITGFAATFTRRHGHHPSEEDYVDELVRRAEVAERRVATLEFRNESLTDRVDELERYCWRAGVDPGTGDPVVTSHERGDDGAASQAQEV